MDEPIGAVAIARNEGERLQRCLRSLAGRCELVVYVDSGSTDGSVAFARAMGADVVELDLASPFTMARARNAGIARLRECRPDLRLVQLVDGDCELDAAWLDQARAWLAAHPRSAVVCGRRRERYPEKSVYNRLCDTEWNSPVGPALSCGGDALMRIDSIDAVGGYNESLIAGEEPELCLRLRQAGWGIDRIDAEMTLHDAAILSFPAWWRRTLRGGYGALDVRTRLRGSVPEADIPFRHLTTSAVSWTVRWLWLVALLAAAGAVAAGWHGTLAGIVAAAGLQVFQALRIAWGVRHRAASGAAAFEYGLFTMIGKWAQVVGQYRYRRDRREGRVIRIIEYKS